MIQTEHTDAVQQRMFLVGQSYCTDITCCYQAAESYSSPAHHLFHTQLTDFSTHRSHYLLVSVTSSHIQRFFMAQLPYVIGQAIYIFILSFVLLLSFFFPRLISAVGDWMSAILPHTVWP